jgi:two-component system, NarL family, sensor kinase
VTAASTSITIEIIDDGVGIGADAVSNVGLTSMRDRASELGGTLTIEAAPRCGTRVRAVLPVGP